MADIIAMPKLGFDMAEGTLVRWVIAQGETVEKGQVLAEIETDKATVEVESSASGILYRHMVAEGDIVPVGSPIAVVAAPGEEVKDLPGDGEAKVEAKKEPPVEEKKKANQTPTTEAEEPIGVEDGRVKASPLARRMAEEHGLKLGTISGSGPGGRIVKGDVEQAIQLGGQPKAEAKPSIEKTPTKPAEEAARWIPGGGIPDDERVTVDKLRSIIGKRMVESKTQLPHFYITREVDAGPVMALRKQVNEQLPEEQKLSVNDFIIKATALALRQFPNLNASLTGTELVRHGQVNIGVAVSLDSGLMTIVSKDADQKPIRVISQEIKEMAARARQGKVRTEDIEGSTFSISNLGMFDVEHFIAIINPPEAAILAVGSVKEVPVVAAGEVKPGLRMKVTISADHRISDGAEAARFMQALGEFLENPLRLLL